MECLVIEIKKAIRPDTVQWGALKFLELVVLMLKPELPNAA